MNITVPIIKTVDLLVVGGTHTAINQAVAWKKTGGSAFVITPYSYFGEDSCAGLQLHQTPAELNLGENPRPNAIKRHYENLLLEAEIEFLYQSYPVKIVLGRDGFFAGLVIANRSGFQIIAAKGILDSSERSLLADLAHLPRKPFRAGRRQVERIVLADTLPECPGLKTTALPCTYQNENQEYRLFALTQEINFTDHSAASLAAVEVQMRNQSFHPRLVYTPDQCNYQLLDGISISYNPDSQSPIFFAQRHNLEDIQEILSKLPPPQPATILEGGDSSATDCQNQEMVRLDRWTRYPASTPALELNLNTFPSGEEFEVLVVGGGTSGAPAAIAAGRGGAKTLCLEQGSALGGLCTLGRIGSYWFGNRVGFCQELDQGITKMGPEPKYLAEQNKKDSEWKRQWLLQECSAAGVEVRFNHSVVAALKCGNQLCGALVASPWGVQAIRAKVVIDATGNADLAAAAGAQLAAETIEPAVQGAGLPPIILGNDYSNTDFTFIDDSDAWDATRAFVQARHKFSQHFDIGQMLATRERRRIVGDLTLQPQDFYANRQYGDTITIARSNFDTHGFIIAPMFMLQPTDEEPHFANVPFRALLPQELENILVTGLAVSAHRDCLPLIRMQPDVHNQGYAAGLAAALAVEEQCPVRKIPLRKLQSQLIKIGILPDHILFEKDCLPGAAADDPHARLANIFLDPAGALPALREEFAASEDLFLAQVLAFLGDASGREVLARSIANSRWDEGWNYRGMGQFGFSVSPLDCQLVALASLGDAEIIFLEKLQTLTPESAFSHFRIISLIFMKYPSRAAIEPLENLLTAPGMARHALKNYRDAIASNRPEAQDNSVRNAQLKELYLARALNACQPGNIQALRSLNEYANGMQGHYARFARAGIKN